MMDTFNVRVKVPRYSMQLHVPISEVDTVGVLKERIRANILGNLEQRPSEWPNVILGSLAVRFGYAEMEDQWTVKDYGLCDASEVEVAIRDEAGEASSSSMLKVVALVPVVKVERVGVEVRRDKMVCTLREQLQRLEREKVIRLPQNFIFLRKHDRKILREDFTFQEYELVDDEQIELFLVN
ncbi:hypothetical protein HPP92_012406 [Vanilla planifolia]|uniref:Ubiquitin-like domain-containing protein n=1 Tax=Vanilla planifolia TaxID=51239 RepID=A0A835R7Z5_VANPL|nr:hypothetical protein HPP92_012406 [Vanilla planifolia]